MPLTVQNVNVHVVDVGAGTPTLFVHGVADSSDVWAGVISRLKKNYRCLAFDLPNFNRSSGPEDFDCSLENMAAFVDGVVTAIGIKEPLNLVVHDFGGPFGLAWAIKHPEKIKHLVIMDTVFFSDYRWHFWAKVWRTPLLGELSWKLMSQWIFIQEMKRGSRRLDVDHLRQTFAVIKPAMHRMILRLYRATDPENFKGWEDELLKVTSRVPTCVIWGDRDPYISKRFAERFGAGTVHHLKDSGHWIQVEEVDKVAQLLLNFFSK